MAVLLQVRQRKLQLSAEQVAATVVCYTNPSLHWQAVCPLRTRELPQVTQDVVVLEVQVRQLTWHAWHTPFAKNWLEEHTTLSAGMARRSRIPSRRVIRIYILSNNIFLLTDSSPNIIVKINDKEKYISIQII